VWSDLVFALAGAGTDTGFNGWFIADLPPTVALDISGDRTDDGRPNRTSSDSWKHAHVPVERPVPVEAHDRIVLSLTRLAASGNDIRAFAQLYTWQGTVQRATR
jgi:type I protein arginine methyltransferase